MENLILIVHILASLGVIGLVLFSMEKVLTQGLHLAAGILEVFLGFRGQQTF